MKIYKELREGIFQLIPVNTKGEYANINTNTGMILYCKRTSNILPSQSKMSVLEFQKLLSKDKKVWCGKEFQEWRNINVDIYNTMIDKINNMELVCQ